MIIHVMMATIVFYRHRCTCAGRAGAAIVARALPHCASLFWLSLCDNDIGNHGAIALAEALTQSTKIALAMFSWRLRRVLKGGLERLLPQCVTARATLAIATT